MKEGDWLESPVWYNTCHCLSKVFRLATKPIGITGRCIWALANFPVASAWLLCGWSISTESLCCSIIEEQNQGGTLAYFWAKAGWCHHLCPQLLGSFRKGNAQFSSVARFCPTLCDPMDYSTPGFPVHHQLSELTQTHVNWVSDAIQPFHECWVQEILERGVQFLRLIQCCKSAHFNIKEKAKKKKRGSADTAQDGIY